MTKYQIESMLSARLFVHPQVVGERIYFISNLSGRLSLYVMDEAGSVPEPLIPPDIALPNPEFVGPFAYRVLPELGKILLMLDKDGDENYQPMLIPIDGGLPELLFGERFAGQQVQCTACDPDANLALFTVDPRTSPVFRSWRTDLNTLETIALGESLYGNYPDAHDEAMQTIVLADGYTAGDAVLYLWREGQAERELLYGKPIEMRAEGEQAPLNGIGSNCLAGKGLLFTSSIYDDRFGLTYFSLESPERTYPVEISGLVHSGNGEMTSLEHRLGDLYTLGYNIDGCSWVYEGQFDEAALRFTIQRVLVGDGALSNGKLESLDYEKASGRYILSFSTATSPSQIYLIEPDGRLERKTNERLLGISTALLAPGEDYPYTSHDGLRISARLYLPAPGLGYDGPRPVIFYIHGGPQSQERPDFAWFSMPLIQFLTLSGFAVWVPNVRGSSGYGLSYMKRVDHDWGGLDRLDHVAAFELLRQDARLDMSRAGVMGRSYGGYMTLTLAGRHPELWKAAVDMFGPYSLFTFMDRLPETWKTFFYLTLGHPEQDKDFLTERSPSTYLSNLSCPMLVIQGAHDPRVIERESHDLVENLRAAGKDVEYLVFPDEGHDVIKYANKVNCYQLITSFFKEHLLV